MSHSQGVGDEMHARSVQFANHSAPEALADRRELWVQVFHEEPRKPKQRGEWATGSEWVCGLRVSAHPPALPVPVGFSLSLLLF